MRALVLGGAGAVCRETTRDLAQFSAFEEIVIADANQEAVSGLLDSIGDPRLKTVPFDADDYGAMLDLFPGFDVVVNGLPFRYDLPVNQACVEAGVNGLDLSSDDPQFALDARAQEQGMIFVPGVGATPGVTNMMARRASEVLDRVTAIEVFFAAFRCLAPAPGLLATTLWEFNPHEEERQHVYFEEGRWHPAPPLSGGIRVRFHDQIGEQEVFYVPHDEAYSFPRSFPSLRRAAVRGCFPPHVMALMGALMSAGVLSNREVRIRDISLPFLAVVRDLLAGSPIASENPVWAYGLVVEAYGERAGRQVKCTYRNSHPPQEAWGGPSAYFKNVGIPLSIGAQMIASGQTEARGVKPPEQVFPSGPFFAELARRDIRVEETIEEMSSY